MGNTKSVQKVNFEDIQFLLKNKKPILINTMEQNNQTCLIKGTIAVNEEEGIINNYMKKNINVTIVIYDKNSNSEKLIKKYNQLLSLGFYNVYIYPGGLFEWLCLQDIYGFENFPTTSKEWDILRYKAKSIFNSFLLRNDID
jgi:hypothetical protein